MNKKEAQARITINKLLEAAGWHFSDEGGQRANISCEHRVTKKKFKLTDELGNDFEKAANGFVDYLLLDKQGRPVAVVEAKSEKVNPLTAKEQAKEYAYDLRVRYVFLSNGLVNYFWDLLQGNPTRISHFLSLEQLGKASEWEPNPQAFVSASVDENYIAVSQDPLWLTYSDKEKNESIVNKKIKLLRGYQIDAVKVIQKAYSSNKNRFLLEMATGTGKTLLSAAIVKLFIRTGNADRVLFFVDRLELETQAWKNFNHYLGTDGINTIIYKENRDDWRKAQVVITTIQSLSYDNRYVAEFAPSDFQLIISDEAHRTISGNNRVIFEYFVGAKLGLTATPRDYLRGINVDELSENDPRQLEKRLLLDTYRTFGCDDGKPTFRYSLIDAVRHQPPYLVNPKTIDTRTIVTTDLLSKEGYKIISTSEDDEKEEEIFFKRDFEKKFFSPETNATFARAFRQKAKRDPLTGEIGKTIFFAVSRKHATKMVTAFNEEIEKMYPGKYNSDFAVQVTSDIPGAQEMTRTFANNNLNGTSRFKPEYIDYPSSKTRVCVTVGMMTTGYDCEDILNVVLCRPIFSPTDFVQIKGRGTRLYTFVYSDGKKTIEKKKDNFYLFDFFANCEYFEKDYKYDEVIPLPPPGEGGGGEPPPLLDKYTYNGPDSVKHSVEEQIGLQGMRIDREMFSKSFEDKTRETANKIPEIVKAVADDDWEKVEEYVKGHILNKPEEYWNVEKLREAYGVERRLSLREILKKVFGKIDHFKTKEDIATEYFERFLSTEGIDPTKVNELQMLFTAYLLYDDVRLWLNKNDYGEFATDARLSIHDLTALGTDQIKYTLNYIKDNIPLNQFMS
jgi:type I restriction enzyme, R subunit